MSISLEDAIRILREQGCTDPYTCPRCRTNPLTITQNGTGPVFACTGGCEAVDAWLEATNIITIAKGPHVDILEIVRGKLNLPELTKIVKHGRTGSAYNLHLDGDRIVSIGSITTLTSQAKFRQVFLPQVRRNPPRYKTPEWDEIVEQIEQIAEERDAVATMSEETISWISAAVTGNAVRRNVNTDNSREMFVLLAPGREGRPPFFDTTGRLHLRLEHIVQWLGRMSGLRVTQPELSARLSELDFERVQHAARSGEKTHKARYWASPPGFEDRL